jgi:hypothetical protein
VRVALKPARQIDRVWPGDRELGRCLVQGGRRLGERAGTLGAVGGHERLAELTADGGLRERHRELVELDQVVVRARAADDVGEVADRRDRIDRQRAQLDEQLLELRRDRP